MALCDGLARYGRLCGAVLARGHARAGDPSVISGYLGQRATFDEAMASFASAYADTTGHDHGALLTAIQRGEVPVAAEH